MGGAILGVGGVTARVGVAVLKHQDPTWVSVVFGLLLNAVSLVDVH